MASACQSEKEKDELEGLQKMNLKIIGILSIAVIIVAVIGFLSVKDDISKVDEEPMEGGEDLIGIIEDTEVVEMTGQENAGARLWLSFELKDIRTGQKFRIDEFDKPVLLESFAVWCPLCLKQQKELKRLHEEIGESFISISLDTDPNEDEARVLEHIERNNFNWRYAVSPAEVTKELIDEFGPSVVNAPSTPIILICSPEKYRILQFGIKNIDELKSAISSC
jgi:thiol-disulfide isomerase/thioredoxin